jgi:uncharacterized repeat protein (TIGR03803 family)
MVLYNFRSHATFDPPVFDASNNLYGATWDGGGTCRCGEVYKLSPGGRYGRWTYQSIHRFTGGDDGGFPQGGVILDGKGNLFGTAAMYGSNGFGVVFELTPRVANGNLAFTRADIDRCCRANWEEIHETVIASSGDSFRARRAYRSTIDRVCAGRQRRWGWSSSIGTAV